MVKVLPPYKPGFPATSPKTRVSVQPSPHVRFIDDVGYFDALGRDPFQMFHVWGIKNDEERAKKAEEILDEWPGSRHRRHLLLDAAHRGDVALVRCLVDTGLKICPDIPGRNGVPPKETDNSDDEEGDKEEHEDDEEEEDKEEYEDDDQDEPNAAPLHIAALQGHLECVKIMMETGQMNVDVQDNLGRTPLMAAAQGGKLEVVKYLLEKGGNPTLRLDGEDKKSQEVFEDLAGADALELAAAAVPLQIELLKVLLEHPVYGSSQRERSKETELGVHVTPLAVSKASRCNVDALKYLLDRGYYPMEDKDGKTKGELLDDSQRDGIQDSVPEILELSDYDTTMLMLGYLYPTDAQGKVLRFEVPEDFRRPFTWGTYGSISRNDVKKFEWLHDFGVKEHDTMSLDEVPQGQHVNIQSVLQRAAQNGAIEGAKHLIDNYNAQPDGLRLPPGTKIIFDAAMNRQEEFIKWLLDNYPIDIHSGNGSTSSGPTVLYMAICMKSFGAIEALLRVGGPVDSIDEEILNIDKPISAVLTAEFATRTPIRLQTEDNAQEYIKTWQDNWQKYNAPYVRLELVPKDKEWISKLVPRKLDAELQERGPLARKLNRDDTSREDPCEYLVEFPIVDEVAEQLEGDEDTMPPWRPLWG